MNKMGYTCAAPDIKYMNYPKFKFFLLRLLGEENFIKQAKSQIDYINYVRKKNYWDRFKKPPRSHISPQFPSSGHDSADHNQHKSTH